MLGLNDIQSNFDKINKRETKAITNDEAANIASLDENAVVTPTFESRFLDNQSQVIQQNLANVTEKQMSKKELRKAIWDMRKDIRKEIKAVKKQDECDLIIMKDGSEVKAKVTEITSTEIKYKKCENLNGPVISIMKSQVFMIKYPNGTKDIINPSNSNVTNANTNTNTTNVTVNTNNANTSNKSFIVAVLLWFFLGLLGIHRFYLGYTGLGVLYLLTAAIFGLGWIIDGILFLTGGLKPRNGRYVE